jgi:CheY-like chemotaxis protein
VIRGDQYLLRMLLTNLIERCVKATPPKGKVGITFEPVGEFVEVQILSDDGTASDFVEIHRNTAAERRLAIYVAEQIAYAHEGSLTFMGIDEEVREVTLTLPMQLKGRGRGKILVVDDNPQAGTLLEYALQEEGYEAVKALNGLEGLKLAKTERVDLVILDILLPGIDGFEVCHRLRAAPETATTPVIMISAKAREEDRATALRIGADAYFGKPLGMSELMKAIENLLEEGNSPGWGIS